MITGHVATVGVMLVGAVASAPVLVAVGGALCAWTAVTMWRWVR